MTGLDKILAGIETESSDAVAKIRGEADAKAAAVMQKAEAEAAAACAEISAQRDVRLRETAQRAESAAQLNRRKALLAAKQQLIAETIGMALEKAEQLPDAAYFDTIVRMAAEAAHAGAGELCLCAKDLARAPADLESRVNAALHAPAHLALSAQPAPIRSGFLLRYGGIEENCSFDAVFAARHDEMQDQVCKILFS